MANSWLLDVDYTILGLFQVKTSLFFLALRGKFNSIKIYLTHPHIWYIWGSNAGFRKTRCVLLRATL